ncbi:hypothetical protein ACI2S5_26205 [Ralstonia nicotianae]|uniref:hypothetical protein n=1 Tax=Ralstonia pseudosolanacearum TaxID=1310165 RepID=UPI000AC4736C|nr:MULTISPECIES: hypothetical protein [Ralstonia]QKL51175.1 hypothetical protein HI816_04545 [Ralstonia solanacearum]MDO3517058.1 hypothetical protein [Ralstonia pseudosolanacearum]MDO3544665.1 hypothetical protein [Ralstonia pseudosolanacearum]QKM22431.1 hypothetical protein HI796_04540 [Ralstonia solanacearum]QKM27239.1 hypothetical protein HI795_04545 [Ralstonia solanacearum]
MLTPSSKNDGTRAGTELRRIPWNTWSGVLYSNAIAYFIILATGVTLHTSGELTSLLRHRSPVHRGSLPETLCTGLFTIGILSIGWMGWTAMAIMGVTAMAMSLFYASTHINTLCAC